MCFDKLVSNIIAIVYEFILCERERVREREREREKFSVLISLISIRWKTLNWAASLSAKCIIRSYGPLGVFNVRSVL